MIRFSDYISIVFSKAIAAFDLSILTVLLSAVKNCLSNDSLLLVTPSTQPMRVTLVKSDYKMPITPAVLVFPLRWDCSKSSVHKIFVNFPDTSKRQDASIKQAALQCTDKRLFM
ncbi:MAG: hypothetical protein CMJ76_08550 [Planctomycetaceae bacterium]|nr:hypothetical protein [Planctomycetaceae bacterium]